VKNLMRVNPKHVKTRDQTLRAATAVVAGPALLYSGYKFPGSGLTRAALMALGAALIYTHFSTFQAEREPEEDDFVEDELDRELDNLLSGLSFQESA
tara:strand:+ start:1730 stop:2020 length:291 start_codon:yes stop_codon:yes gene_type:complete